MQACLKPRKRTCAVHAGVQVGWADGDCRVMIGVLRPRAFLVENEAVCLDSVRGYCGVQLAVCNACLLSLIAARLFVFVCISIANRGGVNYLCLSVGLSLSLSLSLTHTHTLSLLLHCRSLIYLFFILFY